MRNMEQTELPDCQKAPRDKRVNLIAAMSQFKPKTASAIQFYNYVREFCIIHNCSIDDAMESAPASWEQLSEQQRDLYNSEVHAALPIPVPRHLLYRALQMERAGRWTISSATAAGGGSTVYSMESYSPPLKPTRLQARLQAQKPRYDNLADACRLDSLRSLRLPTRQQSPQSSQQQQRGARAAQLGERGGDGSISITRILSDESVKRMAARRRVKATSEAVSVQRLNGTIASNQKQPAAEAAPELLTAVQQCGKPLQERGSKRKHISKKQSPGLSAKLEPKRQHPKNKYSNKHMAIRS
ncbi:CG11068 [Drosophila busckii]|uniref:CG11068 n=1 Tax=Drosophila busckii TaxID=30019 RepID=A0A0M5J131_DROBS|nr:uncharacterized protein LOC108606153 [Drosophila busckii]XP_017851495.1 uncharacterized protein LOC108606153 [Drosophila busckii]ALC48956.1 CG11068 [Drosophila busckii]